MKAKDRTEEVLKSIHVLFSKAEYIDGSKKKVIVDKDRMFSLLKELNECMYDMMDEYELTESAKDKAKRKTQQQSDEMLLDAKKNAEDIYSASFMYTDRNINMLRDIIVKAEEDMEKVYQNMKDEIKEQKQELQDNQIEIRNQLSSLIESEKYMKLLENENLRIKREKEREEVLAASAEWADKPKKIVPEIRIDKGYFKDKGIGQASSPESEDVLDPLDSVETLDTIEEMDFSDIIDDEEPKRGLFGRRKKQ